MSALFDGLVDDAGLFPPTELPPAEAVRRHRSDRAAGHPMHTHQFLVSVGRLEEVRAELDPADRFSLGLIADDTGTGRDGPGARLATALSAVEADPRLTTILIEAPLKIFGAARTAVPAALDAVRSTGAPLFLEPPTPAGIDDLLAALPRVGDRVIGAKLRCGGTSADLFPTTTDVSRFIVACVRADVPFKATAGLHRAVRHQDPGTGFTHHGYLNLLLATAVAVAHPDDPDGPDPTAVQEALEITDAAGLARHVHTLREAAARARTLLISYGSCSTATPVNEAAAVLDLIRKDLP